MTDNFSFFTFSVFFGCSFEEFSAAVLQSYGDLLHKGNSDLYPNIVFLSSNQGDGLLTGCYSIYDILKCKYINFSVANKHCPYPKMAFKYTNADEEERVVMALKEDRWTFFQKGEPLPFENMEYYNNRRIKDRINFDIIKEYMLKLGIDFYKMDSSISNCTTFIRTEWGD